MPIAKLSTCNHGANLKKKYLGFDTTILLEYNVIKCRQEALLNYYTEI